MNNSHNRTGVPPDATAVTKSKRSEVVSDVHNAGGGGGDSLVHKPRRSTDALRALDYRKPTGGRFQRCSRCQREHELTAPVLYNVGGQQLERSAAPVTALMPLMLGQDLLGFICGQCFYSTCQHIVSLFPDAQGFPHVDQNGMLVPTPRCECGTALHYSNDGRELLCAQCDTEKAPRAGEMVVVDG